ncbi:PucR family transcriptional regulator [Nocardioides yefusunii]|uniref:PucR family transcriptional regulator n=1 Tax=Nocardioides yefusunii TaxID=2500546 RepID=A0ABW1QWZ8_9ACTN|nr:helix-turn-helix domain-containing protein [Nocardioides yefusunii]
MTTLVITPEVRDVMRAKLATVGEAAVNAIIAEVPSYVNALSGHMGENIRNAVSLALGGFISLASRADGTDLRRPGAAALEGAYMLGRGEARSGRSMEALLAAYRVGSRESWRQMASALVENGVDAATIASFAELVFTYMDQLSDASVTGHSDETASSGRIRQQLLDELARSLVAGDPDEILVRAAERAEWEPPETLTAVLLPEAQVGAAMRVVSPHTLRVDDLTGETDRVVLLVPDAPRRLLLRAVQGRQCIVGPPRPWTRVRRSYRRAVRALTLPEANGPSVVDTEHHLAALAVSADVDALRDLRARVLAPLADHTPTAREKLTETLRAWLLLQGRRDAVAEALFVHPQTVRYRVGQLREAYGDALEDPHFVREAIVALGFDHPA